MFHSLFIIFDLYNSVKLKTPSGISQAASIVFLDLRSFMALEPISTSGENNMESLSAGAAGTSGENNMGTLMCWGSGHKWISALVPNMKGTATRSKTYL